MALSLTLLYTTMMFAGDLHAQMINSAQAKTAMVVFVKVMDYQVQKSFWQHSSQFVLSPH